MRILSLLTLLTFSTQALAQVAPDAGTDIPVADQPGRSLVIEAGNIVPFKAACLDEQEDVRRERMLVRAQTKVAEYEKDTILPTPAFVAILAGVAAVVGGGTALVFALTQKH